MQPQPVSFYHLGIAPKMLAILDYNAGGDRIECPGTL